MFGLALITEFNYRAQNYNASLKLRKTLVKVTPMIRQMSHLVGKPTMWFQSPLNCVFVFSYADCWFSHEATQIQNNVFA